MKRNIGESEENAHNHVKLVVVGKTSIRDYEQEQVNVRKDITIYEGRYDEGHVIGDYSHVMKRNDDEGACFVVVAVPKVSERSLIPLYRSLFLCLYFSRMMNDIGGGIGQRRRRRRRRIYL